MNLLSYLEYVSTKVHYVNTKVGGSQMMRGQLGLVTLWLNRVSRPAESLPSLLGDATEANF